MRGGACNPDGSQSMSHSSNPFRNFMQNFFLSKGNVRQKMEGYSQGDPRSLNGPSFFPGEQQQFSDQFGKEWELMAQQFEKTHLSEAEMHRMMQEQWHAEQMKMEEMRRIADFEQRRAWEDSQMMVARREQEQLAAERQMGDHWANAEIQYEAKNWKNDFVDEEYKGLEGELEAAFKDAEGLVNQNKEEGEIVKESANHMINVMQSDPDPRFQNSRLLHFLKKLETGEYEIKENQLIENNGPEAQKDLEKAWNQANMDHVWSTEEQKFDGGINDGPQETDKMFDNLWNKMQAGEFNSTELELEEEYKKVLAQMENMGNGSEDMFADMWNVEQDVAEYQNYGDVPDVYKFDEKNPYENDPKSLENASLSLNEGRTKNAILALEAHLKNHPEDGNSWRILGKLHMDNDEDRRAVTCFLKSVNSDNKNLDNLLALGVSCTNILDEVQAMNHLKHWMMNNPRYQQIITDPSIVPETTDNKNLNVDDIRTMNARLIEKFETAKSMNPQDPELATSLAVLYFVARDYAASVNLFNEALKYDTENYSLWNKLGATLAHLGRADEAIEAYNRALELKPNYVRAWVNLGICSCLQRRVRGSCWILSKCLIDEPRR